MKKNSVKIMTMLGTLLMTAVMLIASAWTADVNAETAVKKELAESYEGKTVVIQTNDVHGAFEGYQYVAGLKEELERRGADVVLVDSGDYMQGSIYAAEDKGATAAALMSDCGYDYASLGNHEFDYGTDKLLENLDRVSYTTLCANLVNDADGKPSFTEGRVHVIPGSDLKIGFYGLLTSETLTSSTPGNVSGMSFLNKEALNSSLCGQINSLEEGGADVIIGLTHLGTKPDESPELSTDVYVSTKEEIGGGSGKGNLSEDEIKEKYILLDAHNHSIMTEAAGGEPVMSTGTKLMNAGIVVIDEASEKIVDHFLYRLRTGDSESAAFREGLASNETVAAAAQSCIDSVNEKYGEKFAESRVWLNGNREKTEKDGKTVRGNRDGETNLGDLVADAFLWYGREVSRDDSEYADKTVAIVNGGGIRASVEQGDIRRMDILNVLPFGNTICFVYIKGSGLLEVLEATSSAAPAPSGGFPQISGMEIVLDESAEYLKAKDTYPDSTFYPPAEINRVTIKSVNGKPFDKDATYKVIVNNFCAAGGDAYRALADRSENVIDTGMSDEYAFERYIADSLNGVIGEDHKEPKGRIETVHGGTDDVPAKIEPAGSKAPQPMKVKALKKKIRRSAVRKKAKSVRALKVSGAAGTVTYKKLSGSKRLSINKKTGKIKIKKGTRKGSYKIKVRVSASGDADHAAGSRTVTVRIRLR